MKASQPTVNRNTSPSARLQRTPAGFLASFALALISVVLPVIDHVDFFLRSTLRVVTFRPRPRARIALPGNGKQAVVISGATSGIGLDAALTLASQGVLVFACGPDEKQVAKLAPFAHSLPGTLVPVILEVTDKLSIERAVQTVEAELVRRGPSARLIGIVSNAGILSVGQVTETDEDELRRIFEVNTFGAVAFTKAFLPQLKKHGQGGRILVTSSMAKDLVFPVYSAYVASKHALEALFVSLRAELEPELISVSIMRPGGMETGIVQNYIDRTSSDPVQWRGDSQGLGPEHTTRAIVHAMTSVAPLDVYRVGLDSRMSVILKHALTPRQLNALGNPHKQ